MSLRQILKANVDARRSQDTASLPLAQGEPRLASAARVRSGARWASWADCLRMVRQRHPIVADTMIEGLGTGAEPCFQAVRSCVQSLTEAGFVVPSWTSLAESEEVVFATEAEAHEGWQQKATQKLYEKFHHVCYWPRLTDAEKAMMQSQDGQLASFVVTAVPTNHTTRFASHLFRILPVDASVCLCPYPHAPADVAANRFVWPSSCSEL